MQSVLAHTVSSPEIALFPATPVAWADLQERHLADAIEAYRHRHRRFGGLD